MGKNKRINFQLPADLYKEFSKKCIDLDKSKTDILIDLIQVFLKKK